MPDSALFLLPAPKAAQSFRTIAHEYRYRGLT